MCLSGILSFTLLHIATHCCTNSDIYDIFIIATGQRQLLTVFIVCYYLYTVALNNYMNRLLVSVLEGDNTVPTFNFTYFDAGNFGEVHVGILTDELNNSKTDRVAIKTLRGAYVSMTTISV